MSHQTSRIFKPADLSHFHTGADKRQRFRDLAATCGVPFKILAFDATHDELRRRIEQRQGSGTDASDANLAVLERQLAELEPLRPEELAATTTMVPPVV